MHQAIRCVAINRTRNKQRRSRGRAPPRSVGLIRAPAERKHSYTGYVSQTSLITTGSYYISGIAVGDDYTDREGRAIRYLHMNLKMMLSAIAATTTSNFGRWAIVLDRQPNGTLATYAQVFNTAVGLGDAAIAPQIAGTEERFRILSDHAFHISPLTGGKPNQYWDIDLDLARMLNARDQIQRFNSTVATVSAVNTNALLLVYAVSGQSGFASASNYAVFSFQSDLEFQE